MCSSPDTCIQCKGGYYMTMNRKDCTECSTGCKYLCGIATGSCNCRAGFTGEKCDQCAPNFQPYPHCSECASQYHGAYCNETCPGNCKNKTCDKYLGACTLGCKVNFSGNNCTICISGFYGTDCSLSCSGNCLNGACDTSTGYCHYCKSNYMGNMCNSCIAGQYGDNCDEHCPPNCKSPCQRSTGKCDSCNDGFSGDKCCLNGTGCQTCSSDNTCSACVAGLHGESCDQKCPTNCAEKKCDKLNGTCSTCTDGFYGDNCTLASTGTTTVPSFPVAAVAGGVIGGVVVLIAVGVILFIFFKRRSINKTNVPSTMAKTDDLTTDRVYANDAAIIAAPKESNTYETLMNTFDTTNDMAPYTSLNNYEAMELPGNESRSLRHIHYTDWPHKGVPDDVTNLVEFRNKVNSTKTNLHGPIIIHCSAGVGRTGIYIALDILTLRGKQKGVVDIFDCVKKLRQQRTAMVQTAEQYEYLYRALVHTLSLGSENIPTDRFIEYTASLSDAVFDRLSHCSKMTSDEETAAIARNKALIAYNRPGADIPGDINRPRLYFGRTTEDNDYINALFVNTFQRKNQFILAQTPLVNTVDDFLTLVLQENCCCIVSMDAADLLDKTICTYVPAENQTLSTDAYEVKSTWLDCNQSYSLRTLKIKSKNTSATITVQHFMFANWSYSSKTPNCPTEFLTFVKQIQKLSEETTQLYPVLVHCSSGSELSALPCVVLNLLQKIEIEHEVSVINTVRQVKVRRSKAIPNKEQFKFCHQCVSAYIQSCDLYYNSS